jgi:hypothetical protein
LYPSQTSGGGVFRICDEWRTDQTTYESILKGGIFFEEEGVQFCPDKMYRIKFNYWFNKGTGINFRLSNGLVNNAVESITEEHFSIQKIANYYYQTYQSPTTNIPSIRQTFNIGTVAYPAYECHEYNIYEYPTRPYIADYSYAEIILLFRPDNYYSQLWVIGNGVFFNSLAIEEICLSDIEYNSTTIVANPTRASNSIQFQNVTYTPAKATEFIAGNTIVLKNNVRITPQNQGSVHLRIDKNICSNNNNMQSSIRVDKNLQETYATEIDEIEFAQSGGIKLYPNPTTGLLYISQPPSNASVAMQIYDTMGKMILVKEDIRNLQTIDISSFSKGIYFIKIISEETGNTINKIILK